MRRSTLLLVAALALPAAASCDGSPAASRSADNATIRRSGTANASAVGAVTFTYGFTTEDLSFAVFNNGSSTTTGFGLFYSHTADVVAAINVTCLHVSGTNPKTATFLGTIVQSSDSTIVGHDAYWQVQDGSTDYASLVSLAEGGNGPSCTTPGEFDLVAVTRGNITVN